MTRNLTPGPTQLPTRGSRVPWAPEVVKPDGFAEIPGLPEGTWNVEMSVSARTGQNRGSAALRTGDPREIPLHLEGADEGEDDGEK